MCESLQALNPGLGLWIAGITGITWINPFRGAMAAEQKKNK
jgi:hypothetical protein